MGSLVPVMFFESFLELTCQFVFSTVQLEILLRP